MIWCYMFSFTSSRHCSEARLREGVHLRQRHEEERPQGAGGGHGRTLPGRRQEERRETAALWFVWHYSSLICVCFSQLYLQYICFSIVVERFPSSEPKFVADLIKCNNKEIPAGMKLPAVTGSLTMVFVFCFHRLQCVRGWCGRCRHDRAEKYRQQAQWETCVRGRWLWCLCQDPGQPDHLYLWNSHFQ